MGLADRVGLGGVCIMDPDRCCLTGAVSRKAVAGFSSVGAALALDACAVVAQDHWAVDSADVLGVTHADGVYVAVDAGGGTRLSRDGVAWLRCGRVTDQPLRAVAHGPGRFVAAGDYGSVITSPDGLVWESQISGTDVHLQGVAYGEGRFVVAGEIGRIRSSEDGKNWTRRASGTGELLSAVSYLDGQFLAVGGNYAVVRSDDGVTWMNTGAGGNKRLNGIAYGNGVYVAVGTQGFFATSANGINWDSQFGPATMDVRKVAFGGGVFVALGSESTSDGRVVYRSVDGRTWTQVPVKGSGILNDLVYADGRFLAVGEAGAVAQSVDGANWALLRFGTRAWLRGVAYGRGRWVAVGWTGVIQTSEDGAHWELRRPEVNSRTWLQGVAYGREGFVAVERQLGTDGRILYSPDGRDWTVQMKAAVGFNRVVRGASAWVAVGVRRDNETGALEGVVSRSVDGLVWSLPQGVPDTGELTDVAHAEGRFVAVGLGGVIVTSDDGVTWVARPSGTGADLLAVGVGGAGYVASGQGGTLVGSTDGESWVSRESGVSVNLSAITWARGAYVAVGDAGAIVVSRNGIDWKSRLSGAANRLSSVGFGAGRFVAVGDTGTVVSSAFEPQDGIELSMPEPTPTPIGGIRFSVLGRVEGPVVVERASDLKTWGVVRSFGAGELPGSVVDGTGSVDAGGPRYYRARQVQGR